MIASNLKNQGGHSADLESLYFGIQDVFKKNKLIIEEQECSMIGQGFMQQAMEKKVANLKAEGQAFLDANKLKDGVKVTASGLQYQVVTSGSGKTPTAADNVTVHYTGKLVDGTVFDSSVERNEPATFGVGQVIPGWTEALQLMREGDRWILFIPSELGYGGRGAGGRQQAAPGMAPRAWSGSCRRHRRTIPGKFSRKSSRRISMEQPFSNEDLARCRAASRRRAWLIGAAVLLLYLAGLFIKR